MRAGLGRGARVADSDGLENRCPRKGTVGSNPTLSAIQEGSGVAHPGRLIEVPVPARRSLEVLSISHSRIEVAVQQALWRGGRVAEGAALEMPYMGNRIAGSNPALSATPRSRNQEG